MNSTRTIRGIPALLNADRLYQSLGAKLAKVCVCGVCGRKETVDPAHCLRHGWPKCCGQTMGLGK